MEELASGLLAAVAGKVIDRIGGLILGGHVGQRPLADGHQRLAQGRLQLDRPALLRGRHSDAVIGRLAWRQAGLADAAAGEVAQVHYLDRPGNAAGVVADADAATLQRV